MIMMMKPYLSQMSYSAGCPEVPREHVARLRAGEHSAGLRGPRGLRAAAAPGAAPRHAALAPAARTHAAD